MISTQEKYIRKIIKESLDILFETKYNVFHGTEQDFTNFSRSMIGTNTDSAWNGYGFYFSDSKAEASLYGKNIVNAVIEIKKPFRVDEIQDSSVQGSGIVRAFSKINELRDLKFEGRTYSEINNIILNLENGIDKADISYSEGTKEWFKNVYFEYGGEEYAIRNRTEHEIKDPKYIKSLMISKVLQEKYDIISLPIRIKDAVNPVTFTQIMKDEGYDGVIADNNISSTGKEYVVFDETQITIT